MQTQVQTGSVQALYEMANSHDSEQHAVVREAAGTYIRGLNAIEARDYVLAAAQEAIQRLDVKAAWMLRGVINGPVSYGENVKTATALLLSNNPHLLQYFPTNFAKAVADRITVTH